MHNPISEYHIQILILHFSKNSKELKPVPKTKQEIEFKMPHTIFKFEYYIWWPKEAGDGVSMVAGGIADRRLNFLGQETE